VREGLRRVDLIAIGDDLDGIVTYDERMNG
jgi:hypothetical protein